MDHERVASQQAAPTQGAPSVGVGIVICRGDTVLLVRRKGVHGSGTWSTPGGHLEFGESFEECAARETSEEVGIAVSDLSFVGITNDLIPPDKHYLTVWMATRVAQGDAVLGAPDENDRVLWAPWDSLPSPLFVPFANLLGRRGYPAKAFQEWLDGPSGPKPTA